MIANLSPSDDPLCAQEDFLPGSLLGESSFPQLEFGCCLVQTALISEIWTSYAVLPAVTLSCSASSIPWSRLLARPALIAGPTAKGTMGKRSGGQALGRSEAP